MKHVVVRCALALLLLPALARAQGTCSTGGSDIAQIANNARAQATSLLNTCAKNRGINVSGQAVLTTTEDTSAALIPLAGVENLTRDDLQTWQTIGLFTAAGPPGASAPSGTFTVRVQVPAGSSTGSFQIVDESGNVVQDGELTVSDATTSSESGAAAGLFPSGEGTDLYAPCYYPYGPYFRIYPSYYFGCYRWAYGWHWGSIRFHYCWWPPFYPYCWWYYPCWW